MTTNCESIITGIRPTGNLTIANFAGAVRPLLDLQKCDYQLYVFVADLHALTDHEPAVVARYRTEVVRDYIALGLDTSRICLYLQYSIEEYVAQMMLRLSRHVSIAELTRVPTLKDKIKQGAAVETANGLLAMYPVMMACDIFLQRAILVPVGEDQIAHLEIAREIARRFNAIFGLTLIPPEHYAVKPLRILSLKGDRKMSKSVPESAIFLTDTPDVAAKKVQRAQTAAAGLMTDSVESLFSIAECLPSGHFDRSIDEYREMHCAGQNVMGDFKKELGRNVADFLVEFQQKRAGIGDDQIATVLASGAARALSNAHSVLAAVREAMGM